MMNRKISTLIIAFLIIFILGVDFIPAFALGRWVKELITPNSFTKDDVRGYWKDAPDTITESDRELFEQATGVKVTDEQIRAYNDGESVILSPEQREAALDAWDAWEKGDTDWDPPSEEISSNGSSGGGLLPCKGLECQFCHLAELIGRVINFGLKLVIPIGVVFIAWGGLMMIISGGGVGTAEKPGQIKKAKGIITAAIIGIVISLTAWLLISTLLQIIAKSDFQLKTWTPGATVFCKK